MYQLIIWYRYQGPLMSTDNSWNIIGVDTTLWDKSSDTYTSIYNEK